MMNFVALRKRAAAVGVTEEEFDKADDAEDTPTALIQLIVAREAPQLARSRSRQLGDNMRKTKTKPKIRSPGKGQRETRRVTAELGRAFDCHLTGSSTSQHRQVLNDYLKGWQIKKRRKYAAFLSHVSSRAIPTTTCFSGVRLIDCLRFS